MNTTESNREITTLPPAERAVIVLESHKTEIALQGLVTEAMSITDVIDPVGREQAHRLGMRLKSARTAVEKAGKSAREDAQAFSKAVIAEEKRLIAVTESEERRVIGLRDAYDARIEAEKAAKAARLAKIKAMIADIKDAPMKMVGASSRVIFAEIEAMQSFVPSADDFGGLVEECESARAEAIKKLQELHAAALAQEAAKAEAEAAAAAERECAEQARIEAERIMAEQRAIIAAQRLKIEQAKIEADRIDAEVAATAEPALDGLPQNDMGADQEIDTHAPTPAQGSEAEGVTEMCHAPSLLDELRSTVTDEQINAEVERRWRSAAEPLTFAAGAKWAIDRLLGAAQSHESGDAS